MKDIPIPKTDAQRIRLLSRALDRLLRLPYLQECGNLRVGDTVSYAQRAWYAAREPKKARKI